MADRCYVAIDLKSFYASVKPGTAITIRFGSISSLPTRHGLRKRSAWQSPLR